MQWGGAHRAYSVGGAAILVPPHAAAMRSGSVHSLAACPATGSGNASQRGRKWWQRSGNFKKLVTRGRERLLCKRGAEHLDGAPLAWGPAPCLRSYTGKHKGFGSWNGMN